MTSEALDRIEHELRLNLPGTYREFVQSAEFGEGFQEFYGEADEVIERTKKNRDRGFFGAKWPESYLVIGDDGAGDDYFCDCSNPLPAVRLADHELTTNEDHLGVSRQERYETFVEFWKSIVENHEAVNEWFERKAERRKNKRWWQFWIR